MSLFPILPFAVDGEHFLRCANSGYKRVHPWWESSGFQCCWLKTSSGEGLSASWLMKRQLLLSGYIAKSYIAVVGLSFLLPSHLCCRLRPQQKKQWAGEIILQAGSGPWAPTPTIWNCAVGGKEPLLSHTFFSGLVAREAWIERRWCRW